MCGSLQNHKGIVVAVQLKSDMVWHTISSLVALSLKTFSVMEVHVSLATTGERVYSEAFSEIQDQYIWELRLQLWRELSVAPYFSLVLFRGQDLLADTAKIRDHAEACQEGVLHLHLVLRSLRLPSDEERRTIISGLEFQQRSLVWSILSRGVQMTSTIPAGTARESTLVRAITTRQVPEYEAVPLPDLVTTLLLAMCDPNDHGAPPRSPLELAIRYDDAPLLELLLQFRADPQRREDSQEFPIIVAAARRSAGCVQTLLAYRADPRSTEQIPSMDRSRPGPPVRKCKTVMDVASHSPPVLQVLQTALEAEQARSSMEREQ